MEAPKVGERVWYVWRGQQFVPAIITQTLGQDMANLVLFATPDVDPAFTTGTLPKMQVRGWERAAENEYPPEGVWFRPVGQWALT
jgi:uncharacterized protein (UPF0548 family)